jgi:hypothetical protein
MKEFDIIQILMQDKPGTLLGKTDEAILQKWLPELIALKGIETKNGVKHKDNYIHTLKVLDQTAEVTKDVWTRLIALTHDFGKAKTKRFLKEENKWTFHNHELVSSKMLPMLFVRLGLDPFFLPRVQKVVEFHGVVKELCKTDVTDSAIRRFELDLGDLLPELLLFASCDITTRFIDKRNAHLKDINDLARRIDNVKKADILAKWRPPIDAIKIMEITGLKPGRELGILKAKMESELKAGKLAETEEDCINWVLKNTSF